MFDYGRQRKYNTDQDKAMSEVREGVFNTISLKQSEITKQ